MPAPRQPMPALAVAPAAAVHNQPAASGSAGCNQNLEPLPADAARVAVKARRWPGLFDSWVARPGSYWRSAPTLNRHRSPAAPIAAVRIAPDSSDIVAQADRAAALWVRALP